MKKHWQRTALFALLLGTMFSPLQAQDDSLLDLLGDDTSTDKVVNAFKSPRVINGHSMEMLDKGALDFRILHRFGKISQGFYDMFGLDNASMRMGFDYGVTPNLTVGFGRSTSRKELDGFLKYRLLWQSTGAKSVPVSVVLVGGATFNTLKEPFADLEIDPNFTRRLAFYTQAVVGRKFSEKFSAQLVPTWLHRNIVENTLVPNDMFALGFGARYKFVKRVALVVDYYYAFNRFPDDPTYNPTSIGFDIETGGHVFQLHFSNAVGMNERAFLTDANGSWLDGDIQFGFNLSRVFQLNEKKKKKS
ncbi:DUF5777 family beta-barrel protein [Haliscomenobacter hydrossis]|uniref:DUF5777 domain-containing protein n=1 Tax=Haliscomenobacter hydrossis (strain ATCC 27775 / DSM 1100 / LMG 10767 / O) TaxID=760192 RepID=F4KWF8_HALH1|nr:DUF5777 family beta-barrel protein [Haliscomenobacter hydrossis]AEE50308.1 hypothetical protein Halhy_2434 [Haliscomenobacter hydrossis DSM 1100]